MSKEKIYFRVAKGSLIPADSYAVSRLRDKNYRVGDVVAVTITKLRNPAFNRLVHRIGQLVVENIDDFHGMDAHQALKRLQLEANAGCEEISINIKSDGWNLIKPAFPALKILLGFISKSIGLEITEDGMAIARIPRSLSFSTMDEGEYYEVAKKICNYIADKYWPDLTGEQIENMAESFLEAA